MRMKKRMLAAVLAAAMTLSSAVTTLAATKSPQPQPEPKVYIDVNTRDHEHTTVTSKIVKDQGKVQKIVSDGKKAKQSKIVTLNWARNKSKKRVPITKVGTGKKGVFDSKYGRKIEKVFFKNEKKITVNGRTFRNSNVKKVVVQKGSKIELKKNVFRRTKLKDMTLTFNVKSSKNYTLRKDCFGGLGKKATMYIRCSKKATFKLMEKKAKRAGFKGTIKFVRV